MFKFFGVTSRSESPTQAYLVLAIWLYRKFQALKDSGQSTAQISSAMKSTILAYDNMCHVDSLKISKKDLPFPAPFDKVWYTITKVIDRLHLRNHKDPRCKQLYNAEDKIPSQFKTMACEQTFVWGSRLKKIVCAMTRLHQLFFSPPFSKAKKQVYWIMLLKKQNTCIAKIVCILISKLTTLWSLRVSCHFPNEEDFVSFDSCLFPPWCYMEAKKHTYNRLIGPYSAFQYMWIFHYFVFHAERV